jgi:predicted dehydrogenase
MRMDPVRIGIIGTGTFTRASHIPVLTSLPTLQIRALCDTDASNLRQAAALVPHRVATVPRFQDLLGRSDLDAVLVATPTHLHAEIAIAAFAAGKHVFCEKPLAPRPEQLRPLLEARQTSGRVLQVGYVYRYAPIFQRMRARIDAEEIGQPRMIWAHEFRAAFYTPWRYDLRISGGTLVEKCCHHFDLFQWMLGAPAITVAGFGGQAVVRPGAEVETITGTTLQVPDTDLLDHAWVLTEHANGARGSLGLSLFSPHGPYGRSDADLESLDVGVIGDQGKLLAYVRRNELRFWPRAGGEVRLERIDPPAGQPQGWHAGGREQWEQFARCVRTGERPPADGILGVQGLLPAFAGEAAIRDGRVVSLEEIASGSGLRWPEIL